MNQIEEHKKLVEFLHDVYVRKNHDYGDSFSRSFGKYGVTAALVRMEDKWNRLENLAGGAKQRVPDEGLRDTCLDLATFVCGGRIRWRYRAYNHQGEYRS